MRRINYPGLPKWPTLLVSGESVTEEQAAEIIFRTNGSWFSTNDKEFANKLFSMMGFVAKDTFCDVYLSTEAHEELVRRYGVLELSYIYNSQIASNYVGGPHGWCHWDGSICSGNFSIGKWPSVEEVRDDWALIAKTFPYLRLTSQLLDEGIGKEFGQVLVEFHVFDSVVEVCEPTSHLQAYRPQIDASILSQRFQFGGERGCTYEQFQKVLNIVSEKAKT